MSKDSAHMDWRSLSDEQRALAYSPSKALPDGDLTPFLDAYARDSAATYDAQSNVQVLAYGDTQSQTIDLFLPECDSPVPLHVFIHGGYWQALSKRESTFPANGFLDNDIAFAALDYTLAPDANLDAIVTECVNALSYLFEHAITLGIDPSRISVSGSSAGAHLTAMSCLKLPKDHQPNAVILLSGIYELEPLIGTYVNDPLKMDLETAQRNSPQLLDLSGFPNALLAWGEIETDEFKRQSRDFAALLPKAKAIEIKSCNHFDIAYDLSNGSELSDRVLRLARSHKEPQT